MVVKNPKKDEHVLLAGSGVDVVETGQLRHEIGEGPPRPQQRDDPASRGARAMALLPGWIEDDELAAHFADDEAMAQPDPRSRGELTRLLGKRASTRLRPIMTGPGRRASGSVRLHIRGHPEHERHRQRRRVA